MVNKKKKLVKLIGSEAEVVVPKRVKKPVTEDSHPLTTFYSKKAVKDASEALSTLASTIKSRKAKPKRKEKRCRISSVRPTVQGPVPQSHPEEELRRTKVNTWNKNTHN